jgi:hypothetical protein
VGGFFLLGRLEWKSAGALTVWEFGGWEVWGLNNFENYNRFKISTLKACWGYGFMITVPLKISLCALCENLCVLCG